MTPSRKKPGVAFWATVVVAVALVAYPLSFGPACWLVERRILPPRATGIVFRPLLVATFWGKPPVIKRALQGYAGLMTQSSLDPAFQMAVYTDVLHLSKIVSPE
jgi:hypothetical protein